MTAVTHSTIPTPSASVHPTARRVQYRVGHGGFHATFVNRYANTSNRLTYVYDVGAKPDKAGFLLPAIDDFVQSLSGYGITEVDYLFLSHIDEDHVNGLAELFAAFKNSRPQITVKNLILPWLSTVQKLFIQSHNNHRQSSTVVSALTRSDEEADNFLKGLGADTIIRIAAKSDDVAPSQNSTTHQSNTPIRQPTVPSWMLIPIKMSTPQGFERRFRRELGALLAKVNLDPNNIHDHEKILTNHRTSVRQAMNTVAGVFNVRKRDIANRSSLALLHGAFTPNQPCVISMTAPHHAAVQCRHGWLHTGDLPLREMDVWKHLDSEIQNATLKPPFCVVVAPHHGSNRNHNDDLYSSTNPGTVLLTTGRKLSGTPGTYSYPYNLNVVNTAAASVGAVSIELNNT